MSGNPSRTELSFPFAELWSGYLEQADAQGKALLECLQDLGDPQKMQRRWLEIMSRSLDSYMRSPAFLEAMKRNIKAMTDLKAFQDQLIQDFAHHVGIPLASDIYGLFERLYSVEHMILGRLKSIEGRLGALESKLGGDQGQV